MTRKHFAIIAAEFAAQLDTNIGNYEPGGAQSTSEMARRLARQFKAMSTTFQPSRFFEACGLDSNGYLLPTTCDALGIKGRW